MASQQSVPARVRHFHGWTDSPVWYRSPDKFDDVDLSTLPITAGLRDRLQAWNDYAGTVLSQNHLSWPDSATEAAFVAAGAVLAQELREELAIEVIYTPEGNIDTQNRPVRQREVPPKASWTAYAALSGRTYRA